MSRAVGLLLAGVYALAFIDAQQPTRDDRATPPPSGNARVAGVVVDAASPPQPLRRAIVTLTGSELPGGRTAISDDEGRFAFDRLPAGRFTLSATRPAYLPGAYGAARPGGAGVPLQVGASQQLTNLRLTLARGAAITGTLRDESGEPASNLFVYAIRLPPAGPQQMLQLAGSGMTDDRGVYRIFTLPAGRYVVASAIRLGNPGDVAALSAAQIDEALRDLRARATGSAATAAAPATAPTDGRGATFAYAPVFYPGVSTPAAAEILSVATGEERDGVNFAVGFTRMATIEGVVRTADGGTPTARFVINTDGLQLPPLVGSVPTFSSQATASGRAFKYTNVVPGRYRITAHSTTGGVTYARAEVEITGDDVSNLSLVLQPTLRMSGRIVFDASSLTPPADLSSIRVSLVAANGLGTAAAGYTALGNVPVPPVQAGTDGRFELTGIVPETYRISTTVSGWWLRSVIVNGRDVLDYPLEIRQDIAGAVVTYSDRQTTLSGKLVTAGGDVAPAYFVAVFPADRSLWRPEARRIQLARAGTDGTWSVKNLPAGAYLVAALTDVDADDLRDRAFLETLTGAAIAISLGEGEQKTLDLKIGSGRGAPGVLSASEAVGWRPGASRRRP